MDISSMLEVEVKEESETETIASTKDNILNIPEPEVAPITEEERKFYALLFDNDLASVRFWRLHCTACDAHIGSAPSQSHNMFQHPILLTLLCAKCRAFYGDGAFEQGDDATDMFCRWCANGGSLYCCSYCSNTFCTKCIRRNFTALVRKKIEADEKWKCFVCNPSDLTNARAVCWALLEHVKTVKRILQNSKVMSIQEIEDKMNLDESPCCPRTRKRKRRRNDSNSEDEDITYIPANNGVSNQVKRKQMRKYKLPQPMHTNLNGVGSNVKPLYPIRPRPTALLTGGFVLNEQAPEFSKIRPMTDKILLSSSSVGTSDVSVPRFESNTLQSPVQCKTIYCPSLGTSMASNTYVQPSTADSAPRTIIIPQSQFQSGSCKSSNLYQPTESKKSHAPQSLQSNTMVSIPASATTRPRILCRKTTPQETLTSNVIELDSDSDEPEIVENPTVIVDNSKFKDAAAVPTNKVVPVALAWDKTTVNKATEEQPLKVMSTSIKKDSPSFSDVMLPHSQELKQVLRNIDEKLVNFFDLNEKNEDIDVVARKKVTHFYQTIRDTMLQLAHANDRAVREYNDWIRSRKETNTLPSIDASTMTEHAEIPLDMICVNDSDTEPEVERLDHKVIEPSDLVKHCNVVENMFFCKAQVMHRAVGNDIARLLVDKASQVYDVVSRDYEKCIGYSVVKKVDYNDSKTDDSASVTFENSGKYEEQFIFYLQHIEDHGIEIEDTEGLTDSNEMPCEKRIETNSPFISHSDSDQIDECERENSSTDYGTSAAEGDESVMCIEIKDKDEKFVDHLIPTDEITESLVEFEKTLKEVELRNKMDSDAALAMLNNDVSSNQNDSVVSVETVTLAERVDNAIVDDCAIIDD